MLADSEVTNKPEAVMEKMLDGFRFTQMVCVAARLGLADLMADEPQHINQLAQAAGAHPGALYRLLRALAALPRRKARWRLSLTRTPR